MSKKDIKSENEVYFLGSKGDKVTPKTPRKKWVAWGMGIVVLSVFVLLAFLLMKPTSKEYYFEPETVVQTSDSKADELVLGDTLKGYVEISEETINDVPMYVYIPHNAKMSLALGGLNKADSSIIFVAQAADIRGDNKEIVGDFVLAGNRLSRGDAKAGFCAIINDSISIGVSDNTPLLDKAIENKGYFFRQYPLVNDGVVIENNPKNKSIRRALAVRSGRVVMVESRSAESFHDFSQALVDIGVTTAIYLVGTNVAYGWYYNQEHRRFEYGVDQSEELPNTTYIVWRSE